jgi:hypothetical protein
MYGHEVDQPGPSSVAPMARRWGRFAVRRPPLVVGLLAVLALMFGVSGILPAAPFGNRSGAAAPLRTSLATQWYDQAWPYRRAVQIGYPGSGNPVSNYQVQIQLGASFDFGHATADGNDVRVTASDGITLLPFWIESWDPVNATASIWVKIPTIPAGGTSVYLYYGNLHATTATPAPVPVPPTGPFTKATNNPQPVANAPCGGTTPQLLPENMVVSGGEYYTLITDRCSTNSIALLASADPAGPWTYDRRILTPADLTSQGDPRNQLDSPNLVQVGTDWYVFYSHFDGTWNDTTDPALIGLAKSTTGIDGPYTEINPSVLGTDPTGTWDDARVAEPYVVQKSNGDWVMVYMGDASPQGGYTEQVGIATSTQGIEGPYVKPASNPVIPFGLSGSLDAGTIADPWVVLFQGTYYIGYTASPTKAGWNTTYATTTDWQTFTKSNTVILPQGATYDSISAFRGAVTRIGDTYYLPYTSQDSSGFHFSMATQPTVMTPMNIVNNPDAVFDFYDGFSGAALDAGKWSVSTRSTSGGSVSVSSGYLTLTAPVSGSLNVEELTTNAAFGPGGVLLEASARHDTATGDAKTAGEVGFGTSTFDPSLRIVDYSDPAHFQKNVSNGGQGGNTWYPMTRALDSTHFLLHRVGWAQSGAVTVSLGGDAPESLSNPSVANPTQALPVWFAALALGERGALSVDWVRVRNWVGQDASATVGSEETYLVGTGSSVASSENPSAYGDSVDFNATVTPDVPGFGTPSGNVQFNIDGVNVGDPVPLEAGQANLTDVSELSVGSHTVTAAYGGDGQFGPSTGSLDQTVTRQTQTVEFTSTPPDPARYGGTYGVSATGGGSDNPIVFSVDPASAAGACSVSATTVTFTGVGGCVIDADQAGSDNYADAPQATQSVTIGPASLNITASSPTGVLFGATVPVITPSYSGWVNGDGPDVLAPGPTCTTDYTQGSPVGSYTTSCSGAADPNYDISYLPGSFDVGQAPQTITVGIHAPASADYGTSFTVGATTDASGLTVNYASSGSCSSAGPVFTMTGGIGTCTVSYSQSGNGNYSAADTVTEDVAAGPASLTITASSPAAVLYGATVPAVTPSYSGWVNGDGPDVLAPGPTCGTDYTQGSPVGSYTTSCSGAADPDYDISYVSGSLSVNPAPLTITADDKSVQYSDALPSLTVHYSGFLLGENSSVLSGTLNCSSTGGGKTMHAGDQVLIAPSTYSKAITCGGLNSTDYTIAWQKGTLTVTTEDVVARLAQSDPHAVAAVKVSKTMGAPQLVFSARVTEVADGSYGDISKAHATLSLSGVGSGGNASFPCVSTKVQAATATTPGSLLVSCTVPAGTPVDVYQVTLGVNGGYYTGSDFDVLSVYDPSAGGSTGGGTITTGSGGFAEIAYSAQYLKNGKQVQGSVLYLAEDAAGNVLHVLKGNAMSGLAISGTTATVSGKATLDGVGNYRYIITGVDNSAPSSGSNPDLYTQLVTDSTGASAPSVTVYPSTAVSNGDIFVGR